MIVEQIRYFLQEDQKTVFLEARREVTQVRQRLGVPAGDTLVADPVPDEGPAVVWQCGYSDEGEMAAVESRLMGNQEYEAARQRMGELTGRAELELYTEDEPIEGIPDQP